MITNAHCNSYVADTHAILKKVCRLQIYSELHMMQFDATWMLCFAHMDAGQQGCLQFILQSQVWSPEGSLYGNLSAASGTVTL